MIARALFIGTGLGVLLTATVASAGTKGGMYDMSAMINEGHPFAAPSYNRAPTTMSPTQTMRPIAPPAPTLRYTPPPQPVAQVQKSGANAKPYRPFGEDTGGDMWGRFYMSFGGGANIANDLDGTATGGGAYSISFDPGYLLQGALGVHLGSDFRLETEVAYRVADYDSGTAGGTTTTTAGDIQLGTGMLNLLYDVRFGSDFAPYVGGGLGVAQIKNSAATIGGVAIADKDATEFAYQAILGVTYELNRDWHLSLDGRYIGTSDEDVSATAITLNIRYDL
ncbi:MAG: outer membrane beta-barrel protein [Alphaproteobacteria bacterium]|jgi:opacity protein-like surface antigen|nr:outer membrane beta-barrel protein [Alphaproteobacteria bacterium]